jgi:hypothetical protein
VGAVKREKVPWILGSVLQHTIAENGRSINSEVAIPIQGENEKQHFGQVFNLSNEIVELLL